MTPRADTYTHGHHDAVLRSHRWRTVENSAAYLVPHLRPGLRLLDVGCGPGTLTVDLARRVAPGQVVGIDVASSVVQEARDHATAEGVGNVEFVVGDFRDAGLESGTFDLVHAHQVLQHLRDPVEALAGMASLARSGGLVAARDADYSAMVWAPPDERLDRWLAMYLAVTRRNGAEANAGRWLLRWARAAGLSETTYSTSTWTYATAPQRAWWGGLWADRVTASSLAEQAVDYGIATPAELAGIAAGLREWARQPDAVFVAMHGEILARV
ncbi:MAG: methyltransferase domain-containing protein [Candidatus Dormibacteraeota bacterium]|nr:methyltransferase domain-containing protein [Candidatus Dormibacteraeota bacterium]